MLSNEFAGAMTPLAREFISQAIRSIHIEKLIMGADYDYIIQDRGTLSGKAYAETLGHSPEFINQLIQKVTQPYSQSGWNIYDRVILLINDPCKGLELAKEKQEFQGGDAMESMGPIFMRKVLSHMISTTIGDESVTHIYVDGKPREVILEEILKAIHD